MMSRLPKPRSQSENTIRPGATARTSCPDGERMNRPFHGGPPLARWAPKRLVSSPLIGSRSPRLRPASGPSAPPGSGTLSLRRSGVAAITLPSSSTSRDRRDSSRSSCFTCRRCSRSWTDTRSSTPRRSACSLSRALRSLRAADSMAASSALFSRAPASSLCSCSRLDPSSRMNSAWARNVTVVVQLARDAAGVLPREKKFQGALLAVEIARGEQPPEAFPARGDFVLELPGPTGERGELGLGYRTPVGERAQRAVGLGDGAFGLAQLLARLGAALLGFGDLRAQLVDALAQGLELLAFLRALGERQYRGKQQDRPKPPAHTAGSPR